MASSRKMIDIFSHIVPEKFSKALYNKAPGTIYGEQSVADHHAAVTGLVDVKRRLQMIDKFEGMQQVLSVGLPPLEEIVGKRDAAVLAKIANDELAELVAKYPKRFVAAVACLPMNNIDAALKEAERAIKTLKMKGIQIHTPSNEKPLDSPELFPLYEMMIKYDLPILIHPTRSRSIPDYKGEKESKYGLAGSVGWLYATTLMMMRLVLSGVMEKYPSLKLVAHHYGGMIPFYAHRLGGVGGRDGAEGGPKLRRPRVEYFKMFYADTCVYHTPSLMCGYAFFGADHSLFGTDMAYGGERRLEEAITTVEKMTITETEKNKIFQGNAKKLFHL